MTVSSVRYRQFPKMDYNYTSSSKYYYRKESSPSTPFIPRLSRRPVRMFQTYSYWNDPYSRAHKEWGSQSFVEKIITIVTTLITITTTTVTTTVETVKRTASHTKGTPCRTFLLLFLLFLLLFYLFIFKTGQEINDTDFIKVNISTEQLLGYNLFNPLTKLLTWTYLIWEYLYTRVVDATSMLPVISSQIYCSLLSLLTPYFQKNNSLPVLRPISEGFHQKTTIQPIDPKEIRRIVEQVLAEKINTNEKSIEDNSNIKEIIEKILTEQEEKHEHSRVEKLASHAEEVFTPIVDNINEKFENLDKTLKELSLVKPRLQSLEEKLSTTQLEAATLYSGSLQISDWFNETNALAGSVFKKELLELVESKIETYHADRTGKTDYALMSNGGTVVSIRCTQTYKNMGKLTLFGLPLWDLYNPPETIIKPGTMPGECWAFEGSEGYAVIKLSHPIYVTGVTIEHTPKELTNGHIQSAPYQFSLWGLVELLDKSPKFLGRFKFLDNGASLQSFDITETRIPYELVELRIESNHGNVEYTCLYRFRVHGRSAN